MKPKTSKRVFLLGLVVLLAVSAAAAQSPSPDYPDFSGSWESTNATGLLDPEAGPGPIGDLAGYSHFGFGVDAAHRRNTSRPWIGDYRSPILTPWAAGILKSEAETAIRGEDPFWAQSNCWPGGPAAVLWADQHYFIQTQRTVYIVYARDHEVRRVYLNRSHTKNPAPSWYGESVGRYEGDTLVIDTIGFNDRSLIDRYGTPHSSDLHLIERYKVLSDGKTLEGTLTYDDPKAFTATWSAITKYRRASDPLAEAACAEAANNPVTGKFFRLPTASKPDF
ncbi:MAG TPA: hypothetical protein VGM72_04860 [Micropepsaceae bacterium]|jgi:hypothetical protein